jgi:hypothetical protein
MCCCIVLFHHALSVGGKLPEEQKREGGRERERVER